MNTSNRRSHRKGTPVQNLVPVTHTDLRIRDIMECVGCADLSSFIHKYTQTLGTAPGRYRESDRQKPADF